MATVEGAMHTVRYINPAFCRLIDKPSDELLGKPFAAIFQGMDGCLALLDRVYRTGKSECHTGQEPPVLGSSFPSYMMWPLMADERPVGVMIQVIETSPLHEKTLAMNEALMLGSLRQHELTAVADASNIHLREEVREREQRERDALMLTREVSHRIKNSLQMIVALIAHEIRQAAAPCVQGYTAIQARILAIAELYDLMSRSSRGPTVLVGAYLGEIVRAISDSLLGDTSGITIVVKADALDIDPDRAVPFGLLANELVTNAIKHAFPDGTGRVVLTVERTVDQIEFTVADNGVGLPDKRSADIANTHGSDYVAIFVRQLGGTIAVLESVRKHC
jgi:two-component sensor histidine kinase